MCRVYKFLFIWWGILPAAYAMLSDGIHQAQDYINFAETQKAFKASCYIYDHHRHILQTGVLIAPDIVMTAAHGFEGTVHLHGIIVGFGNEVSHESVHNYKVKAFRMHPGYRQEYDPLRAKYDLVFLHLTEPVRSVDPVPLFEEKTFEEIPPLYVATFGSADIAPGTPVYRRAFALPEADIFPITGDDPEVLYDKKTVMMGAVFFKPKQILKSVTVTASEKKQRTYIANKRWHEIGRPPYALALPGSSGAPVFIQIPENGQPKTYVFGIIQSFSHLSASSFHHQSGQRETEHLLHTPFKDIYGHYQSVFCIPYEVHHRLEPHQKTIHIYRQPLIIKDILTKLRTPKPKITKDALKKLKTLKPKKGHTQH